MCYHVFAQIQNYYYPMLNNTRYYYFFLCKRGSTNFFPKDTIANSFIAQLIIVRYVFCCYSFLWIIVITISLIMQARLSVSLLLVQIYFYTNLKHSTNQENRLQLITMLVYLCIRYRIRLCKIFVPRFEVAEL